MFNNLSKWLRNLKTKTHLYKLEKNFEYKTGIPVDKNYTFRGIDRKALMTITKEGIVTVYKGFMWDGCSPKIRIKDWFCIGTPDGTLDYDNGKPKCYYGTCIHDPMYKFYKTIPYTREQVDGFMLDLFQKSNFSLSKLYYRVVRLFGGIFWK
jgi:hypothetical protein